MRTRIRNRFPGMLVAFCVFAQTALAAPPATIKILSVSPRLRDQSPSDVYDARSTGLDVVGINTRVYLVPATDANYATSITGYTWSVVTQPSGGAVIDYDTSSLLKLHPTKGGEYIIRLVPKVLGVDSTPTTQRIYAARYVGTGTEGSNTPVPPMCGFSSCHGNSAPENLNKTSEWLGTAHAHKLENHLNGLSGSHYSTSCLECHTVSFEKAAQGDTDFYQEAQRIAFNLSQIPTWVEDAATSSHPHWGDLPAALQLKSNIQCESCHGPGSDHMGNKAKISGPHFDANSCRQCHDSGSGYQQKFYQYDHSGHVESDLASEGHVRDTASCHKCHITEGFVSITVDGQSAIPSEITTRNPVSCVACHDPHSEENEHQLRTTATVTLPNGTVFSGGLGNVCANCHNSRVSNPLTTINTSYRGAHHGPQADILLGKSAYDWGMPYPVGASVHASVTTETCVTCHMAPAPRGAYAPLVGDHTFRITSEDGKSSNTVRACGQCHKGLTTTDRVLPAGSRPDYDGDGLRSGIQYEVGRLLLNVRNRIVLRIPGTSWNAEENKIDISQQDWSKLTFNQKAVLYNFNLCSEEKSRGIHNTKYVVAVLQRSWYYLTGHLYSRDYPRATIIDNTTAVRPELWRNYR